MSDQNRIYHLCRVVSPPPKLVNKLICVPSGWIQRRLVYDESIEVLIRYPTYELKTQAITRAFNDEKYSEDWMTIKAVELLRTNYHDCMEILTQQNLEDKVSHKRSHAQLEQGSSKTIDEDDEVIFVSEKPAVQDSEDTQKTVKIEQEDPAQPTETIETPRSRGEVICGPARSIQLSSVRDKSQQATEESQNKFNAQDIASNQHHTQHPPAEKPNRNEPEDQPIRKKVRFEAITRSNLVVTHVPTIQQSSAHESIAQQATNEQNEDQPYAQDKETNRNEPEDQSLRKKNLSQSTKNGGPNLVVTCRPARNIQLLSAYDDFIEQSKDQSNRLVVTLLPSINIQPTLILNKSMDEQVSNEQSQDRPYAQGITSKRGSTDEANRDASDRKLQRMMMKYFQFEHKMLEKLRQKRLKIENEFKKRNGAEEKENDEMDDEEDEVDEVYEEEQSTNEKEIEKKQITMKPDISTNVKTTKGDNITPRKLNPVSLPAEYDKNDSTWTLKYREPGKDLVEIPFQSGVYVGFKEMYDSVNEACKERDIKCLARLLLTHVFSDAALRICSLSGKRRASGPVRPGLNEHAVKVIVNFAKEHGKEQKWPHADYQTVMQSLRCKLNSLQRNLSYTIDPPETQEM